MNKECRAFLGVGRRDFIGCQLEIKLRMPQIKNEAFKFRKGDDLRLDQINVNIPLLRTCVSLLELILFEIIQMKTKLIMPQIPNF